MRLAEYTFVLVCLSLCAACAGTGQAVRFIADVDHFFYPGGDSHPYVYSRVHTVTDTALRWNSGSGTASQICLA